MQAVAAEFSGYAGPFCCIRFEKVRNNLFLTVLGQNLMSGPTQTPAKSSASLNPLKRFDGPPKLLVSKKTAAKIKEIRPPQPSVAQITTNFCFQPVRPKLIHRELISSPAAMDVRIVAGVVIRVI